ncbi:lamin tail domain-containing protein [Parabacteroides sp.]|uniref:lamin tail domain-containing protein n=1 Tax=Parabacteroides sp. TaxID=1869337 RepID=UPI0026DEECE9|nr:lamin tail domain-containing protein [Parabacteroides sp.]MDO5427890.1 lamin tail domain-containing protein [Parabacteroides sp.]
MKQLLLILAFLLPLCAYPQLKEPFNGPEITSDNPWTGDLDCFVIENGWLVSRADPTRKSVSIETPLVYSATMEWEFEIRIDFKPSDQNHIRLHVYLDDQRMLGLKNDYYVQIGSNKKTITFRKHTATEKNPKILIEKTLDVLLGAVDLKVKLTLENHKIWNLYVLEKGRFVLIGSCESEVSSSCKGGQLRFECRYSKTRVNDFACNYIIISDNISIEPEKPDTPEEPEEPNEPDEPLVLPRLLAIQPITESVFQLQYNLPVDIREAIFSISGIGNASRMTYADDMRIHVNISFDKELKVGMGYDLLCSGLMDLEGNKIPESSTEIRLEYEEEPDVPEEPEVPDTPSFPAGSIRINEVMADPKGQKAFPETEYVELYNTTDKAIELNGWSFLYGSKPTVLTALLLDADGYVVLYRSGRDIHIDDAGLDLPLDKFPASLVNTGKELALFDSSGKEIDRIAYEKAKVGIAWERSETGFHLSTDERGGTPGSANSSPDDEPEDPDRPDTPHKPGIPTDIIVLPNEIVFNELLPNPYPEGSEYIELYNRSDRTLPLAGLSVATRKSDGTLSSHYPLSSIVSPVEPQDYALLTKSMGGVSDFYLISSPDALHELKLPVLANTSATLVLFRTEDEVMIDEIRYSSKWHAPSVKNEKGIALERINPDSDTQDEMNWTSASATAGYGTPGYRNSQYGKQDEGEVTGIESPVYSEATKEYTISYHLDESGYTCRAWIFDISGRRISEVVNHDLLGIEGELAWNGLAVNGSKVKTGVYIFYAELVHPQGKIERYKEVFLVK